MNTHSFRRHNQLKVASDLLRAYAGKRILDIGCGEGLLERYLPDRDIIGMDISARALLRARSLKPRSRYIQADIRHIPVQDACVQAVSMIAVLGGTSQDDEMRLFSEVRRVLQDKGTAVILVSRRRLPYSLLAPDRLFGNGKWRHFDPQALKANLETSGFTVRNMVYAGGMVSLCVSLFNACWQRCWDVCTRKVLGKSVVPRLPQRFFNILEAVEFRPFSERMRRFSRFVYVVAQKI
ncbi:MAG: class I SAM-dependent methyltransferase [Candidatus Omnitrophica bacterium]|nr:class I SAM-dependent methyltransferase [Candidatus Omnitrophota bacterium]